MRLVKTNTPKWLRAEHGIEFAWQTGYGAFSVSRSSTEAVREYIRNQAEHHRRTSFKEEFVALLRKHGVEYDERYIWE